VHRRNTIRTYERYFERDCKMPRSMTGFARRTIPTSLGTLNIEARSLNHRFLDISLRLPQRYSSFDRFIKRQISNMFERGRIEISITIDGTDLKEGKGLSLNVPLAREYYRLYHQLKEELNLEGEVDLSLMAGIKDLFQVQEDVHDLEREWEEIEGGIKKCLEDLLEMRENEGKLLFKDIDARLSRISKIMGQIHHRSSNVLEDYRRKLHNRIKYHLNGIEIDQNRLYQEIVFFAERSDISEECVRMNSHIVQFRDIASSNENVGKRLDFLIQEMHREINTIGAKASDSIISHMVVEVKGELEKIREQIQNIE
jgi:uncharacterized protein (TIGR00255 family)